VRRVVPKPALPLVHDRLDVGILGRVILLELVALIRTLRLQFHEGQIAIPLQLLRWLGGHPLNHRQVGFTRKASAGI
jgi:hypothetical protein